MLDDIERNAAGSLDILGAAARIADPLAHRARERRRSRGAARGRGAPRGQLAADDAAPGDRWRRPHLRRRLIPGTPGKHDTPALRQVFDMTLAWFAAHLG